MVRSTTARPRNVIPKTEGSWNTDRYNSAEFGNLKSGVGLLIEFEDESTVSKVKVKSGNSGGKFEIRDGDDPEDAEVIGEGVFDADEGATIEFDEDVTHRQTDPLGHRTASERGRVQGHDQFRHLRIARPEPGMMGRRPCSIIHDHRHDPVHEGCGIVSGTVRL
jgi:hypothetical protein